MRTQVAGQDVADRPDNECGVSRWSRNGTYPPGRWVPNDPHRTVQRPVRNGAAGGGQPQPVNRRVAGQQCGHIDANGGERVQRLCGDAVAADVVPREFPPVHDQHPQARPARQRGHGRSTARRAAGPQ